MNLRYLLAIITLVTLAPLLILQALYLRRHAVRYRQRKVNGAAANRELNQPLKFWYWVNRPPPVSVYQTTANPLRGRSPRR